MKSTTHKQQRDRWEKEHKNPIVLLQMDATDPSSGVVKFFDWLKAHSKDATKLKGMEMCCGKGRSVIWLAQQGLDMLGLDFSPAAIAEAKKRASFSKVGKKTHFFVHDVTEKFPVKLGSLDFVVDCFGSTDIETLDGRKAARHNIVEALKPGGYLILYLLSTDDEFHKEMITKHPGPDPGSFIHPVNGKYEKAFTEEEIKTFYKPLKLVTLERVPKKATFFDKTYDCNHIWAIFQK